MQRTLSLILCVLFLAASFSAAAMTASKKINENLIEVAGSSITLKLGDEQLEGNVYTRLYEISRDGISLREAKASYELGLRYAHFDPLVNVPAVDPMLTADETTHLFIVQFVTQPLEEFEREISQMGGTVHHYIAQFAYLVEMDDTAYQSVAGLPYVRWIGPYHPAYRLEEFIHDNLADAWTAYPLTRYNIQVLAVEQKALVADRISATGGLVNSADAGKLLVEATLDPEQLFQVARWDEVLFIDRWSPYESDMNIVRDIGGANYIESVAGYTGQDVRGEVFDAGFNLNHIDFQSNPLITHGSVGSSSHGAATSGICFGDGTGSANARGLLPDGQGIVASYYTVGLTGPNRYNNSGELIQAPYYAVFQTASVGSDRTTQYTTISADADAYCFDFDLVHCQSQSNAGDQMSRPQAWAKNMVSGGGLYHYNTLSRTDDMWNYGASIGPASDGRVKPTFTHFYDQVWTTYSLSSSGYGNFSGTSAATPIIAGHIGLFFQMWDDGIFGNEIIPGGSVFENRAHSATAKAMLVNTAYQYYFTGLYHDKTRTHQGWGMPDLQKLYDMRNQIYVIDETDILLPFDVAQHIVTVDALTPEFKATLVYSDPPGNPSVQTQHRINDLTLKVTSPGGTVYWGNNGLYDGVWSVAGGSADDKNTVENVFVQNPEAGQWTVEIHADEIIEDSHVETPTLDADYALVISGVGPGVPPELFVELTYQSGSPVPSGGGDLFFDVYVENIGSSSANFDAWLDVEYEGGDPTTVVLRYLGNFLPGWIIDRPNTYFPVPGSYAAGNYEMYGRVGVHPDEVWTESGFPFSKSGSDFIAGFQPFVPDGVPDPFDRIDTSQNPRQPDGYAVLGAYPNPFNPTSTLSYVLPEAVKVHLAIYDVSGRLVATLADGYRQAGSHEVTFDASNLTSGIYLYHLSAGDYTATGKMVLMK